MNKSITSQRQITFVIPSMTGGGAERQMSYLVNHTAAAGYSTTLVTLSGIEDDRYVIQPNVVRVGINAMRESTGLWDSFQSNRNRIALLRAAIAESRPSAVVSFCDRMNIMTLAALRTKSLPGVPVAICERSDPRKQRLGWVWETLRRFYYPRCSACVVQTAAIASYLKPIVGAEKPIHIIPTAFDDHRCDKKSPDVTPCFDDVTADAPKRLLFVGRLSQEKGIDRLLEVWAEIHLRHPEWRLVVAGEGPEKERWLRSQAGHGGNSRLTSSIEWMGWVSDVRSLMAACDAYVLPSRYEGFPNALVEAMDTGLPCIATDCSASIAEIISDNESGLIVSNDSTALKMGLERMLEDKCLRDQFLEKAKHGVAKFRWSAVSARWDKLLESLVWQR